MQPASFTRHSLKDKIKRFSSTVVYDWGFHALLFVLAGAVGAGDGGGGIEELFPRYRTTKLLLIDVYLVCFVVHDGESYVVVVFSLFWGGAVSACVRQPANSQRGLRLHPPPPPHLLLSS